MKMSSIRTILDIFMRSMFMLLYSVHLDLRLTQDVIRFKTSDNLALAISSCR